MRRLSVFSTAIRNMNNCNSNQSSQEVLIKIGKNKEILINDTKNFFGYSKFRPIRKDLYDELICLKIQNSSSNVLLNIHGISAYSTVYKLLQWMIPLWYGVYLHNIFVLVNPISDIGDAHNPPSLKFKFSVRGHTQLWNSHIADHRDTKIIFEAYAYFQFDPDTGLVVSHVVDRIEPPLFRQPWIFWIIQQNLSRKICGAYCTNSVNIFRSKGNMFK
jgi:hypothetical protein